MPPTHHPWCPMKNPRRELGSWACPDCWELYTRFPDAGKPLPTDEELLAERQMETLH